MRTTTAKVVGLGILVWLAACRNDDAPTADDLLGAPGAGEGRQLGLRVTLAPGEENTTCTAVTVAAGEGLRVARFEHAYSEGSHHLLVLRGARPEDVDTSAPFECETLQAREVLYAAQVPDGELALPEDVAITVSPGDTLVLQTHYLNATSATLDAEARVNLWSEPEASVEAGTLFLYDWSIYLPPNAETSVAMSCAVPEEITLLAGMSHMHRRGVGYEAVLKGSGDDRTLFQTTSWEDVSFQIYDGGGVTVAPGSTIDFRCDYRNREDRAIIEGPSAVDNEMCMFVGVYYPKLGADVEACLTGDSGPVRSGTMSCFDALGCAQTATSEIDAEVCFVDVCEASSRPLNAFVNCNQALCNETCSTGGDCMGCLEQHCGAELAACMAADCG